MLFVGAVLDFLGSFRACTHCHMFKGVIPLFCDVYKFSLVFDFKIILFENL